VIRVMVYILLLVTSQIVIADVKKPSSKGSASYAFALDGLDTGNPLMGNSLAFVYRSLGLPDRVNIRKADAHWEVDLEATPADLVFSGFSITTLYYRDGYVKKGTDYLSPGPYYEGRKVTGIRVYGGNVSVRLGLNIGVSKQTVINKLGKSWHAQSARDNVLHYVADTESQIGIATRVSFHLDDKEQVKEIIWSRESGH